MIRCAWAAPIAGPRCLPIVAVQAVWILPNESGRCANSKTITTDLLQQGPHSVNWTVSVKKEAALDRTKALGAIKSDERSSHAN